MQDQQTQPEASNFELELDNVTSYELGLMAKWMKNSAVITFIVIALTMAFLFVIGSKFAEVFGFARNSEIDPGNQVTILLVVMGIMLVMMAAWSYLLLSAGMKIRKGLINRDMVLFNTGLSHAKTFFVIYVVLLVLSILVNFSKF
jgi:hypothetical protein